MPVVSFNPVADHHQWLYANCLSQSQALMLGKTREEAEAELRSKGLNEADIEKLAPHKVIPGNRPSNTLVVERISRAAWVRWWRCTSTRCSCRA